MTPGLETGSLATDAAVDPIVLAVMFVAFLVGAVGPFAMCVIGSIRDERAMRRYAAAAAAAEPVATARTVDPAVVVPAAVTLNPSALDVDGIDPANDDVSPDDGDATPRLAVRS
ncbi:MAG: hypothetical protein RLO51_10340 [Thalassobaculum sp.]|uniref:hypothetical protein n=1 Tax=Thalassobaculum sp. TaxID=2022740 RepID=UPI0032ED82BC